MKPGKYRFFFINAHQVRQQKSLPRNKFPKNPGTAKL